MQAAAAGGGTPGWLDYSRISLFLTFEIGMLSGKQLAQRLSRIEHCAPNTAMGGRRGMRVGIVMQVLPFSKKGEKQQAGWSVGNER